MKLLEDGPAKDIARMLAVRPMAKGLTFLGG